MRFEEVTVKIPDSGLYPLLQVKAQIVSQLNSDARRRYAVKVPGYVSGKSANIEDNFINFTFYYAIGIDPSLSFIQSLLLSIAAWNGCISMCDLPSSLRHRHIRIALNELSSKGLLTLSKHGIRSCYHYTIDNVRRYGELFKSIEKDLLLDHESRKSKVLHPTSIIDNESYESHSDNVINIRQASTSSPDIESIATALIAKILPILVDIIDSRHKPINDAIIKSISELSQQVAEMQSMAAKSNPLLGKSSFLESINRSPEKITYTEPTVTNTKSETAELSPVIYPDFSGLHSRKVDNSGLDRSDSYTQRAWIDAVYVAHNEDETRRVNIRANHPRTEMPDEQIPLFFNIDNYLDKDGKIKVMDENTIVHMFDELKHPMPEPRLSPDMMSFLIAYTAVNPKYLNVDGVIHYLSCCYKKEGILHRNSTPEIRSKVRALLPDLKYDFEFFEEENARLTREAKEALARNLQDPVFCQKMSNRLATQECDEMIEYFRDSDQCLFKLDDSHEREGWVYKHLQSKCRELGAKYKVGDITLIKIIQQYIWDYYKFDTTVDRSFEDSEWAKIMEQKKLSDGSKSVNVDLELANLTKNQG